MDAEAVDEPAQARRSTEGDGPLGRASAVSMDNLDPNGMADTFPLPDRMSARSAHGRAQESFISVTAPKTATSPRNATASAASGKDLVPASTWWQGNAVDVQLSDAHPADDSGARKRMQKERYHAHEYLAFPTSEDTPSASSTGHRAWTPTRVSHARMDNPFSVSGIPCMAPDWGERGFKARAARHARPDRRANDDVAGATSHVTLQPFNLTSSADSSPGSSEGAYFVIPADVEGNEVVQVRMPSSRIYHVPVPTEAVPGDFLHVIPKAAAAATAASTFDSEAGSPRQDGAVEVLHIPGGALQLKSLRIAVAAVSFVSAIVMTVALLMPFWLDIVRGETMQSLGLWGRHCRGYIRSYEVLDTRCQTLHSQGEDAVAEEVVQRMLIDMNMRGLCGIFHRLRLLGQNVLMVEVAMILLQMLAAVGFLMHHRKWARFGTFTSLVAQAAALSYFFMEAQVLLQQEVPDSKILIGYSVYCGAVALALSLGSFIMMGQIGRELTNAQSAGCCSCLVPGHKRHTSKQVFAWDEDNPGEGCPILWRSYGLTRSNLLRNHRGGCLGWLCVVVTVILSIPAHFLKTFDWNGVRRKHFGPPSEEDVIRNTGVKSKVVINYMMYRRSNGIMALVVFIPVVIYHALQFVESFMALIAESKEDMPLQTFAAYQASHSSNATLADNATTTPSPYETNETNAEGGVTFEAFLGVLFMQAMQSISVQASGFVLWKDACRIACITFGATFIAIGVYRWGNFKVSSRIFLIAWAALIAAPFALTMFPTRMFLDFTMVEVIARHAFHEARVYYQMDEAILSCLYADIAEKHKSTLETVEQACAVVESVPYVMPESISMGKVPGLGYEVSLPIHSIPYIGGQLPAAGTDLSGAHAACFTGLQLLRHNVTVEGARVVPEVCIEAAAFLYRSTPPGKKSVFHDIERLVGDGLLDQDPSHIRSEWMLELSRREGVPLRSAVPHYLGIEQQKPHVGDIGRLIRCSLLANCAPVKSCPIKGATLVLEDEADVDECSLINVARQIAKAGGKGLLVLKLTTEWKSLPKMPLWMASLMSRSDRRLVAAALEVDNPNSPLVGKLVRNTIPWEEDRHAITSHGCRCQGLGYDTECKVRTSGPTGRKASPAGEEDHPWCQTVKGCSVAYDLCLPPGSTEGVSQTPSRQCLEDYPCRRMQSDQVLADYDRCGVEIVPATIWAPAAVTYTPCIPPLGMQGFFHWQSSPPTTEMGLLATVDLPVGLSELKLDGLLLLDSCCKYRVNITNFNADVSWRMHATIPPEFGSYAYDEMLEAKGAFQEIDVCGTEGFPRSRLDASLPQEFDFEIHLKTIPSEENHFSEVAGSLRLEELCPPEVPDLHLEWTSIPISSLRYVPQQSEGTPLRSLRVKGAAEDDFDQVLKDWNKTLSGEKTGDAGYHMLSSMCPDFVGTVCDYSHMCGERQVCDSEGDEYYHPGHCRCADGHCYKDIGNGSYACIPQGFVAKQLVVDLVEHEPVPQLDYLPKIVSVMKLGMSLMLSAKEGVVNINGIVGHVLALGPGFLLAAWTAKIIFAHSVIPAYFIYFFPWMYAPFAWSINNVYYQLIPDAILFLGLFGLSFWPIFVAADSIYHGLHRQMTVAEVMTIVNDMLLRYWGCLGVSYGLIIWFAVNFDLNDYVDFDLKTKFGFRDAVSYYMTTIFEPIPLVFGIMESFGIFFMTCVVVCDMFIEMICKENNEAWAMIRHHSHATRREASSEPSTPKVVSVSRAQDDRFIVEMEVIQDWLHLIRDERLPKEAAKLRKLISRAVGVHEVPANDSLHMPPASMRMRPSRPGAGEVELQEMG